MQASTLELLRDILQEADFLATQMAQTSLESFVRGEVKKGAFMRSIEIIGEAAKKIPQDVRFFVSSRNLHFLQNAGSLRMRNDIKKDVGFPFDTKIKAPTSCHAGLPNITLLVIFLGFQGWMSKVGR